jgi:hypothetical protein
LDDRKLGSANIIDMRAHWAEMQNAAFERSGAIDRVDHRSLEVQREEAEQERDKLQERVTKLESVIDGYAMQLIEPGNDERWNGMRGFEVNREWHNVEQAERERKKLEPQLRMQTLRAAVLDRAPQIKLGPAVSAMERKERQRALEQGTEYRPVTERGEIVQAAQEQFSFADDARERFDAARTAYSEARELGFSRTRSAYEAAREALLFGVESPSEQVEIQRHSAPRDRAPIRGLARVKARHEERQRERERDEQFALKRPPSLEESIWDSLDKIGREQSPDRDGTSDAMERIQQRTAEQQQEREREAAEVEREKLEQERDQSLGLGYGM